MGWTKDNPGGSYSVKVSNKKQNANAFSYTYEVAIARLTGNQVSIRVKSALGYGQQGTSVFIPPNEQRFGAGTDYTYPAGSSGATRYWVGALNKDDKKTITVGGTIPSGYTNYFSWSIAGPDYTTYYKVTYKANGGSGSDVTQDKKYGSSVSIYANNAFKKTGHTFSGWNTKTDGSGDPYSPGATYATNANLTLYAQWTPVNYTITYNGNAPATGVNVSNLPGNQTKTYGKNLTLSNNTPTCPGFVFNHWNTKADDSGTTYRKGATYSANSGATLYAIWDGTYGVTYDGNGATGGSTASQTKVEDVDLQISSNGFTWDKHTFVEWNTKADGSGTSYDPNDYYTINAPLTLYAIWLKNNIPVFYKDSGDSVHQVEKAYYKDSNGVVHECALYYKDSNGNVHEIA